MNKKIYTFLILCLSFVLISCSSNVKGPLLLGESYTKYSKIDGNKYYDKIKLTDVNAFNYDDEYSVIYLEIRYEYKLDSKMTFDVLDYNINVNDKTFECDKKMTIDNNEFDLFSVEHEPEFIYNFYYSFAKDEYNNIISQNDIICHNNLIDYLIKKDQIVFTETK